MGHYIDIFVVPVPRDKLETYREQARMFVEAAREHGALSCVELEADDAPRGKISSFPQSVCLKPGETVFVGIATYESRAHRDEVNDRLMKDTRMAALTPETRAFDSRRMFFGGFKPFVGD